jgi:hypothetical protein
MSTSMDTNVDVHPQTSVAESKDEAIQAAIKQSILEALQDILPRFLSAISQYRVVVSKTGGLHESTPIASAELIFAPNPLAEECRAIKIFEPK